MKACKEAEEHILFTVEGDERPESVVAECPDCGYECRVEVKEIDEDKIDNLEQTLVEQAVSMWRRLISMGFCAKDDAEKVESQ